jgi:predicted metal-dependent hydrolase
MHSLRLSVTADNTVRVSVPYWTPYQAGAVFALSRKSWIAEHQRRQSSGLSNGMPVGKTRSLLFIPSSEVTGVKTSVRANEVAITYNLHYSLDDDAVQNAAERACYRALKAEATKLLTPRLNDLAGQHGFMYKSLNIKRMKTRWGSCDQSKNIVLNLFLMQLPWEYIDYVILHELTHTRALHHGPNFWKEFDSVLPGARKLRRQMRDYHPTLQSIR